VLPRGAAVAGEVFDGILKMTGLFDNKTRKMKKVYVRFEEMNEKTSCT
jgi:hypothetical protein